MIFLHRQRFSITEVFQRRLSRNHRDSSIDSTTARQKQNEVEEDYRNPAMDWNNKDNRDSLDLEEFTFDDPYSQSQTGNFNIFFE